MQSSRGRLAWFGKPSKSQRRIVEALGSPSRPDPAEQGEAREAAGSANTGHASEKREPDKVRLQKELKDIL